MEIKYNDKMTHEEFEQHRLEWLREWNDKWRHLDIDFESYMLMKGVSPDEYKRLNEETNDGQGRD